MKSSSMINKVYKAIAEQEKRGVDALYFSPFQTGIWTPGSEKIGKALHDNLVRELKAINSKK